jgi:hypothetical protein
MSTTTPNPAPAGEIDSSRYFWAPGLEARAADFAFGLGAGDYLEFGVYDGSSFIQAYHAQRYAHQKALKQYGFLMSDQVRANQERIWQTRRFFAFDSFEGLPDVKGPDQNGPFKRGDYSCSLDTVRTNLATAHVDLDRVSFIKGWYQDTLTPSTREAHRMQSAAIVHIDCDLYESAKVALNFITPLLQDGTVIIFDDWFQFRGHPQKGEQRAFREWLVTVPGWIATEYHKEGTWRNSFIINRRLDEA